MPTDADLLAQLQTLWQAATPPIVPPAEPITQAAEPPPVSKQGEVANVHREPPTWVWRESAARLGGIERDDVPPESRWWHRATFDQLPYADCRLPCVVADDGDPFDLIGDAEREHLLGRHHFPEPCGFCAGRACHNPQCVALCDEWQIPMPFGKHKGKPVASLDHEYLAWLLKSGMELNAELRREIERVLKIERAD